MTFGNFLKWIKSIFRKSPPTTNDCRFLETILVPKEIRPEIDILLTKYDYELAKIGQSCPFSARHCQFKQEEENNVEILN